MWAYYNLPLPKTKEGKMLLLAIDSGFLGHYNNNFKDTHNAYLRLMGFGELIDLLEETPKGKFFDIQDKYNTKAKIYLNDDGYLHTTLPLAELEGLFGVPLELPSSKFTLQYEFESHFASSNIQKESISNLVSLAVTGKNKVKYTTY